MLCTLCESSAKADPRPRILRRSLPITVRPGAEVKPLAKQFSLQMVNHSRCGPLVKCLGRQGKSLTRYSAPCYCSDHSCLRCGCRAARGRISRHWSDWSLQLLLLSLQPRSASHVLATQASGRRAHVR